MRKTMGTLLKSAAIVAITAGVVHAEGKVVGISWSNFQEERWKTDEAAMKAAIDAGEITNVDGWLEA